LLMGKIRPQLSLVVHRRCRCHFVHA
jgi:hypothetical protein